MRRRTLLGSTALSAALGSAGCLGLGTDAVAGEVVGSSGVATLHAVDDPYVRGGIGDGAEGNYYGDLFTETPAETPFLPGDEDGDANDDRPDFAGRVEDADYDAEFLLVLEARVPGDEPFGLRWGTGSDARWTGWREIALPFERYDWGELEPELVGEEELVCTSLWTYEASPDDERLNWTPARATVEIVDERGDRQGRLVVD